MEILNYLTRSAAAILSPIDSSDRYVTPPNFTINPLYNPGDAEWIIVDGRERNIYETTGVLNIIVDRKAEMKSVGVYRHWKGNKNTKEDTELFNTPELNLLYNPNPLQSKDDFLRELSINRDVMGINYTYGLKGSKLNYVPKVMYNIPAESIEVKQKGNLWQAETLDEIFESYRVKNSTMQIDSFEIMRRAIPNPKNILVPLSPLHKIRMELSNIRGAMGYRNVIIRKKGALGILSGDQKDSDGTVPMDIEEFERIEKEYQRGWGMYQKQMQILMSKMPMKWSPMSYPTKDLMLFEEVDTNMMKVIDLYGLNQNLFSFQKGATISDSGTKMFEAERQAYQNKIIPESEDDMNALSKWLGLHKRGEYLTLDYSHVPAMATDEDLASKIMATKIGAFVSLVSLEKGVSKDEALEMCGLKEG